MRLVPSGDRGPAEKQRTKIAEVAHPGLARRTCATGRNEGQHDVVAGLKALDAWSDLGDDARAFVAAEHGETTHRDAAGDQVVVGVAHPRRFHLDLDLVLDGIADLDLLDRPRLVELPDESAFCLHPHVPSARASEARLEPLVRCVTRAPKQPLGRASPDRYRRLAERVIPGQLLTGQARSMRSCMPSDSSPDSSSQVEHLATWPKSKKSRCHSISRLRRLAVSRNQLPPMP